MNTSSRFAVLSSEIDLDAAFKKKNRSNKSKSEKSKKDNGTFNGESGSNLKNKIATNTAKLQNVNKKKKNCEDGDLQALAFGLSKSKGNKKGPCNATGNHVQQQNGNKQIKSKKKKTNNDDLDESWQKRDEEYVKVQNEESLREAIIQSKLEFEEIKKKEQQKKKMANKKIETTQIKVAKDKKKKDKPITISLDQFNSLEPDELASLKDLNLSPEKLTNHHQDSEGEKFNQEKFFMEVDEVTKKTLEKESRQAEYKANFTKLNHDLKVQKLLSEIEKRDFEIQALRLEVDSLRTQLQAVKSRNKKLCEVISFSEMRSKGELVVELEKVTKGRDEFSEEVTRLNGELEQERTKVSQLTVELKKLQGKKRNADSSSK